MQAWIIFNSSYYHEDSRGEWHVRQNYSDALEYDDVLGQFAAFVAHLVGPQGGCGCFPLLLVKACRISSVVLFMKRLLA